MSQGHPRYGAQPTYQVQQSQQQQQQQRAQYPQAQQQYRPSGLPASATSQPQQQQRSYQRPPPQQVSPARMLLNAHCTSIKMDLECNMLSRDGLCRSITWWVRQALMKTFMHDHIRTVLLKRPTYYMVPLKDCKRSSGAL